MRIGDVLRYPRPRRPDEYVIDGLTNFFAATLLPGRPSPGLERGINPMTKPPGQPRPAVLIRSSPHRAGSVAAPWDDFFDPDRGHVRYFGDNKPGKLHAPEGAPGNKVLLAEWSLQSSPVASDRAKSAPLLLFVSVPADGRVKGNVRFQGVAVIDRVELVSQRVGASDRPFANYRFDLVVLSLAKENERLDWAWINARRDPSSTSGQPDALAPAAWKAFVREGSAALPRLRRSVAALATLDRASQQPVEGTRAERVLDDVVDFFQTRKSLFESVAELVAERILTESGANYRRGWITVRSADHGADFVARIDVGSGLAGARLVVLGQAKCEQRSSPTSGRDIARTVARLRRGWLGVYVTTSYFSKPAQEEVIEDEYPLVLINGLHVAETLLDVMFERGDRSVIPLLEELAAAHDARIMFRRPSEILLD